MIKMIKIFKIFCLFCNFINIFGFIKINNNFLQYKTINKRNNIYKLKYDIFSNLRTPNIYLSIESEFEEVKKKFLSNKNIYNEPTNNTNPNNELDFTNVLSDTNQLSMLNNVATGEWCKNWIYDMINFNGITYPDYLYQDLFLMREYYYKNKDNIDFYIAFFPTTRICNNGPYFIGSFKLNLKSKIFSTKLIIQNPNYLDDDKSFFNDFKTNLLLMCKRAGVVFDFSELKNLDNKRFYMSWKFNSKF